MDLLGYNHKCVYANSMHFHPTPQSRDRMYVVFWKKSQKAPDLNMRPLAFSPKLGKDVQAVQWWKNSQKKFGKYNQQYLYRCPETHELVEPSYHAAYNAIDWSDIGKRIGDRKKPLSDNTIKRIGYGLKKYANSFLFHSAYSDTARGVVRPLTHPCFTQTTLGSQSLCVPFIVNDQHSTGIDFRVKSVNEVTPTIATSNNYKLITPPFIIKGEHTLNEGYVKSIVDPLLTQTVRQSSSLLIPDSFIDSHYGNTTSNHITEPIGTVTTKDRHALVSVATKIEDCYYRMLKPSEIKKVMAFDEDYKILGSGKDQVKQLGNAVTPPAMEWLVQQCVESLN
jgi:DNA (cytosine-5)-methyltransferase 1